MNSALRAILIFLLNRHYIGGKHFPEKKLVISRTRWLSRAEIREFEREYRMILPYLSRLKKRTGKGTEWHISINPRYLAEISELLGL